MLVTDRVTYDPEEGVIARLTTDDGRWFDLTQMIFNWRIAIGPADSHTYDEFYCFTDFGTALVAFLHFVRDGGEIENWVRHVPSHRRRPDGDPAREYVKP